MPTPRVSKEPQVYMASFQRAIAKGDDLEGLNPALGGYSASLRPTVRLICEASGHLEKEPVKTKIPQLPGAYGGGPWRPWPRWLSLAGFVEAGVDSQISQILGYGFKKGWIPLAYSWLKWKEEILAGRNHHVISGNALGFGKKLWKVLVEQHGFLKRSRKNSVILDSREPRYRRAWSHVGGGERKRINFILKPTLMHAIFIWIIKYFRLFQSWHLEYIWFLAYQ